MERKISIKFMIFSLYLKQGKKRKLKRKNVNVHKIYDNTLLMTKEQHSKALFKFDKYFSIIKW